MMGLTMALIGVLIAFCSALVGTERNNLERTLIEQGDATSNKISASIKFRIILVELERLRQVEHDSPNTMKPAESTMLRRMLGLYLDYSKERSLTKAWADSYGPLVDAHFEASEGYERAELIAEVAIVIASVATLLSDKRACFIAIGVSGICVIWLCVTYASTLSVMTPAEEKVKVAADAYNDLRNAHTAANEDESTVELLDPGSTIRDSIQGKH